MLPIPRLHTYIFTKSGLYRELSYIPKDSSCLSCALLTYLQYNPIPVGKERKNSVENDGWMGLILV